MAEKSVLYIKVPNRREKFAYFSFTGEETEVQRERN